MKPDKRTVIVVLLVLAIGGAYIAGLDGGLYVDEPLYVTGGLSLVSGSPDELFVHPPLALYFIGLGASFNPDSPSAVRFPSVLFGVGCIVLVFLALARVGPIWLAATAGVHLATVRLFAHLSVQALLDVYLAFFVLVFVLLFRRHLLHPDERALGRSPIFWCGAAGAAALGCKAYAAFFLLVPLFTVGFVLPLNDRWRSGKSTLAWRPPPALWRFAGGFCLATFVIYLPYHFKWVALSSDKHPQLSQWIPAIPASVKSLYVQLATYLAVSENRFVYVLDGRYTSSYPWWGYFQWAFQSIGIALPLALAAPLLRLRKTAREHLAFVATWATVMLPFFAFSLVSTKLERYTLVFLPPLLLFAYEGIADRVGDLRRRPSWALALAVVMVAWHPWSLYARNESFGADSGLKQLAARIHEFSAGRKTPLRVLVHEPDLLRFALASLPPVDLAIEDFGSYHYPACHELLHPDRTPRPLPPGLEMRAVDAAVLPADALPTAGVVRIREAARSHETFGDWELSFFDAAGPSPPSGSRVRAAPSR